MTPLFWVLNLSTNLAILGVAQDIARNDFGARLGWGNAALLGAAWGILFTLAWINHRVESRSW